MATNIYKKSGISDNGGAGRGLKLLGNSLVLSKLHKETVRISCIMLEYDI